jgi:hypothetical protein
MISSQPVQSIVDWTKISEAVSLANCKYGSHLTPTASVGATFLAASTFTDVSNVIIA